MDELKIQIFLNSEGEYQYDIYDSTDDEAESIDGGLCTTTMSNALVMAMSQASRIIRTKESKSQDSCNRCGTEVAELMYLSNTGVCRKCHAKDRALDVMGSDYN